MTQITKNKTTDKAELLTDKELYILAIILWEVEPKFWSVV